MAKNAFVRRVAKLLCAGSVLLGGPVLAQDETGGVSGEEALRSDIESQRKRIEQLERRLDSLDRKGRLVPTEEGDGEATPERDPIDIGGAARFNLFYTDFDEANQDRFGDSSFELFRLNVDGEKDGFKVSAEYRWYGFTETVHHAWGGYRVSESSELQVGVTKVPFGLLPFAAHNFWFGLPYYVGLGDDYDLGAKYLYDAAPWDVRVAFFKNAEVGSPSDLSRYAADVTRPASGCDPANGVVADCNEETNQINARVAYTLGEGGACPTEIGLSGQWGQLYNSVTRSDGSRWASAAHVDSRCGRWNFQLQAGRQVMDPDNPAGTSDDTVTFGVLEGAYGVASRATLVVANVAYNFPVPWQRMDSLTCYHDFSMYLKDRDAFRDSRLSTTGCAVGAGPIFVYLDWINAENAPFFSFTDPLGQGETGTDNRVNMNVGYYF